MTLAADSNTTKEWTRTFDGVLQEIGRSLAWIDSLRPELLLSEDQAYALRLCAEELLANVVLHNGERNSSHNDLHVRVTLAAKPDRVVMIVEDDGIYFDVVNSLPKKVDQPLNRIQPGGLGVGLIKRFASSLQYKRTETGNRVVAEFFKLSGRQRLDDLP